MKGNLNQQPDCASRDSGKAGREGVAVVMVIGLLAVLMVTAVTFSISMRVERKGAANFRHSIQAKHMAWSAMAEAINDIDRSMDSGTFYLSPASAWGDKSTKGSQGSGEFVKTISRAGMAMIPNSLRKDAELTQCYWIPIHDDSGVLRGRYGYVAVDVSGLLDANAVSSMDRNRGVDTREIQTGLASNDPALKLRETHERYEMLSELENLNSNLYYAGAGNFLCYSRSQEGQRLDSNFNPVDKVEISGNYSNMMNMATKVKIMQGLEDAGIKADQGSFVFNNLMDYLDPDSIPHALDRPYTEDIPMVSEFMVSNIVWMINETNARVVPRLTVEWHYPFIKPSANAYDMEAAMYMRITTKVGTEVYSYTNALEDAGYNKSVDVERYSFKRFAGGSFVVPVATNDRSMTILTMVKAKVTIKGKPDEIVDEAPSPYDGNYWISLGQIGTNLPPFDPSTPERVRFSRCREVIDPRFNWNRAGLDSWGMPYKGHTLGKRNKATEDFYDDAQTKGLDIGDTMYVSNEGRLQSVAELGYLLAGGDTLKSQGNVSPDHKIYGYKWKTIRLLDSSRDGGSAYTRHRIIDHLTITNGVTRGRVNINTKYDNVMTKVFLDCPIGYHDSGVKLSTNDALTLAKAIVKSPNDYPDVGYIGDRTQVDWEAVFPNGTWDDLKRESILIHSDNLLTVRQNMFVIMVKGQSYSIGVGGSTGHVLSSGAAVGQLWRDPFRDSDGNHRWFIRYYRTIHN